MKNKICLLFLSFALLLTSVLEARHIIGGQIKYECTGSDDYTITARVYRDCASNGAFFDDPAVFTIYRAVGANFIPVTTLNPIPQNISTVEFADAPCLLVPDAACIDQADYILEIQLPVISESYFIVYQRCCRSSTVSNLVNPEETGMTLSIEILPSAQGVCNSSSEFSVLDSPLACVNNNLSIDLSTTDVDGDDLVYEFCSPKAGGGLGGSPGGPTGSNPSACDGVAPMPACPPPFSDVDFILPEFSALQPMAGNPIININSSTGMISGVPEFIGQFIVGVCVKEFRNGELLSVSRKDFSISTINCNTSVPTPDLDHGIVVADTVKVFTCGETEWQFIITNFTEEFVENILWEIDINNDGNLIPSKEWSPTFTFSEAGLFSGRVTINAGLSCQSSFPVLIDTRADCTILALDAPNIFTGVEIFPNPAKDFFNINYPEALEREELYIRVLNAQGMEVESFNRGTLKIETTNWPNGFYFLQIGTKAKWEKTTRMVVSK